MNRAAALGPTGAECKVNYAIVINIMRGDADVVFGHRVADHDVLVPIRILVPNGLILTDRHGIQSSVAVHIGRGNGITNFADLWIQHDRLKLLPVGRSTHRQPRSDNS